MKYIKEITLPDILTQASKEMKNQKEELYITDIYDRGRIDGIADCFNWIAIFLKAITTIDNPETFLIKALQESYGLELKNV